ncbi:MAG TPA: DedA family protein [Bacteroidales bacterium]|nr:DedA family protein [Bacteroidales bacterium]
MDLIKTLIDFILHIDVHLTEIVTNYETWTYLILFLIVFAETGLVVTPFLPGDSLLFAAGAIAALPGSPLNPVLLIVVIMLAVFLGDNTNYFIGRYLGETVYKKDYKLIKRKYLDQTHAFYEKHGGITIIMARFMPIVRTFAPFVAGVGHMKYLKYLLFSIAGSIIWVNSFIWIGYFFGNLPVIRKNFSLVIILIILISVTPPIIAFLRSHFKKEPAK